MAVIPENLFNLDPNHLKKYISFNFQILVTQMFLYVFALDNKWNWYNDLKYVMCYIFDTYISEYHVGD